jgi:hypothetical protein
VESRLLVGELKVAKVANPRVLGAIKPVLLSP